MPETRLTLNTETNRTHFESSTDASNCAMAGGYARGSARGTYIDNRLFI